MNEEVKYLINLYNADHDLFDDEIQMNVVDLKLLKLISELHQRLTQAEHRIRKLSAIMESIDNEVTYYHD